MNRYVHHGAEINLQYVLKLFVSNLLMVFLWRFIYFLLLCKKLLT